MFSRSLPHRFYAAFFQPPAARGGIQILGTGSSTNTKTACGRSRGPGKVPPMAGTDSRVSRYEKRPTTCEGCRGDSVNRHSKDSRYYCCGSRCPEQNNMIAQMLLLMAEPMLQVGLSCLGVGTSGFGSSGTKYLGVVWYLGCWYLGGWYLGVRHLGNTSSTSCACGC